MRIRLENANRSAGLLSEGQLPGNSNYFFGNDPKKWLTAVPQFARVRYKGVYPGIDLVYYGNQQQLEFDFVVAPQANPHAIRIALKGPGHLKIDSAGDLVVADATIRLRKPVAYQVINGQRHEVACAFVLNRSRVSLSLGPYDPSRPLVIDPVLSYSNYLHGYPSAIAVDGLGNAYVAGAAASGVGVCNSGEIPFSPRPCWHAFVTKVNPAGTAVVYSTSLGGLHDDFAEGIAVDSAGSAYVTGSTSSPDFPFTSSLLPSPTTYSIFATKLTPDGSALVYSTHVAGTAGLASSIAVDSAGSAYLAGTVGFALPDGSPQAPNSFRPPPPDVPIAVVNAFQATLRTATVFRSQDAGATWSSVGGYQFNHARVVAFDPRSSTAYLASAFGLFKTSDGGVNWQALTGLPPGQVLDVKIDPANPAILYAGWFAPDGLSLGIYKSTDAGADWNAVNTGLPTVNAGSPASSILIDPSASSVLYAIVNGDLYKSPDGAGHWAATLSGNPFHGLTCPGLTAVMLDPASPSTLVAGTCRSDATLKSVDGGLTWMSFNPIVGYPVLPLSSLAISSVGGKSTWYIAWDSQLFKSVNGGADWQKITSGLPAGASNLVVDPSSPSRLYLTSPWLWVSQDGGLSWKRESGQLPKGSPHMIGIDPRSSAVYADVEVTRLEDTFQRQSTPPPLIPPYFDGVGTNGTGDAFVMKLNPAGSAALYSTYLGGSGFDYASGIAVDTAGRAYVTGVTDSPDFPITHAPQPRKGGGQDAFISVFNPEGSALIYSTYLGGTADDASAGIALDAAGSAYIAGTTQSTDFPLVKPFQPKYAGGSTDSFVAKLDPSGASLLYSTYLGGSRSDSAAAVGVDAAGHVVVAGATNSPDFPTRYAVQNLAGLEDAFITKWNAAGSDLLFSTYFGGSSDDSATGAAIDPQGNVFVTGFTESRDFPTTPGASQSPYTGAFIAEFSAGPTILTVADSAATTASTAVAPGEFLTIYGTGLGPTSPLIASPDSTGSFGANLGGTQVFFDGHPAPLLYVSERQINTLVPYEVSGQASTVIRVQSSQGVSENYALTVTAVQPNVFVVVNQDGSQNNPQNPAAEESIVTLWVSGAGVLDQNLPDGSVASTPPPAPRLLVTIVVSPGESCAALDVTPQFAGASPGLLANLLQINVQLPQFVCNSGAGTIQVKFGDSQSSQRIPLWLQP